MVLVVCCLRREAVAVVVVVVVKRGCRSDGGSHLPRYARRGRGGGGWKLRSLEALMERDKVQSVGRFLWGHFAWPSSPAGRCQLIDRG